MATEQPPQSGAAPQTRVGETISAGLDTAVIATLPLSLATSALNPTKVR